MGIFWDLQQVRNFANNETDRINKKNFPVKLVEPSRGRIVELEIMEKREFTANLYMDQLKTLGKCLKRDGVTYTTSGNKIKFEFPNGDMAENFRNFWK